MTAEVKSHVPNFESIFARLPRSFAVSFLRVLVIFLNFAGSAVAGEAISFRVKGTLSGEWPERSQFNYKGVKFEYAYSNGVWQVQLDGRAITFGPGSGNVTLGANCKEIPDGSRIAYFDLTNFDPVHSPLHQSHLSPLPFPSAETDLFPIWLLLTPRPKLPFGEDSRIGSLGKHYPGGTYSIRADGAGFTERIAITNEFADSKFKGVNVFVFERLATTNINGIELPLKGRMATYATMNERLERIMTFTMEVEEVSANRGDVFAGFYSPLKALAIDYRVSEMADGAQVTYLVANDVFWSTNDARVIREADLASRRAKHLPGPPKDKRVF